ncbi:MAG: hypothetical protein ACRBB0_17680 [Pelagimonas sp.]|uniref:hypothetical protein n=1 Tax=Pelagimonas sp. TaxID=2073170 RepID=UPI003D6A59EB
MTDVSSALARRFDVAAANVHTLVNAKATVSGVSAFLSKITTTADDRVVLYVNVHNGSAQSGHSATPDSDVMVFWSQDDPRVIEFALAEGKWLLASDFAKMLHTVEMTELIAIFDACESGALATEVMHDAAQEGRRVATIASAQPGQVANLTQNLKQPLFSSLFANDLANASAAKHSQSFSTLLTEVTEQTQSRAKQVCASRQAQMNEQAGHAVNCDQVPIISDPTGLLSQL